MEKQYWLDAHRFLFIVIVLIIIWGGTMVVVLTQSHNIARDPCSICAERMGQHILCTAWGLDPVTKTFFPNGTIEVTNRGSKNVRS